MTQTDKSLNKRELDFSSHSAGALYKSYLKLLIPYLERTDVEDLQIREEGCVTLIKTRDRIEHIKDPSLTIDKLKTITIVIGNMRKVNVDLRNPSISVILPINNIRFTSEISRNIKSGILISIRIPSFLIYSPLDFGITEAEFDFLKENIAKKGYNAFIIGGTGSGKTSFANMLVNHIPTNETINILGDLHDYFFNEEYQLTELYAKTKEEYQQKVDLLMRTNPMRILISELTTYNVTAVMRLLNTGHRGFLLTLHANEAENSVATAFSKNLVLSGEQANKNEIQEEIKENIDFLIHIAKLKDGKRAITKVTINNKILIDEARDLGIFNYCSNSKEKLKITYKPKKKHKRINVSKIFNLRKQGKTIREISQVTTHSSHTILKILNHNDR